MKTLYSSSFISIVLAFLLFLGYNDQPIEVVQVASPLHFTNVMELSELLSYKKIQVEIFDDLNCRTCTDFALNTIPKIRDLEKETAEIELHLYFVPDINDAFYSDLAMGLKCASQQGQFWGLHTALHENKKDLNRKLLWQLAQELEMDIAVFKTCIAEKTHQSSIEEDVRYASEKNITSKPSMLISGYKLIGNQPFENVQKVINKILKERERISPFDLPEEEPPTDLDLEIENS